MPQLVRKDRYTELAPGVFDGTLDIGLVHSVTDNGPGAGVAARVMGREEPGPGPGELKLGVFTGQMMREHQRGAVLVVALPHGPGDLQLLG